MFVFGYFTEKALAFSAFKNFLRLFVIFKAGGGVASFLIGAVMTDKVAVCDFFSALARNGDSVGNEIMSPSAVFTAAVFLFQKRRLLPFCSV